VTGLGDSATFAAYGEASEKISFLNHYFPGANENDANTEMIDLIDGEGGTPDLFSPDGFNAAIMIVHAVQEGKGDVDAMIAALEGFEFGWPQGRDDRARERPRPDPGDVPGQARRRR
jgi:branched-chain amino acid transport system substrate-binding protein